MKYKHKYDFGKWRDYFAFDLADQSHEHIRIKDYKSPEQLLNKLTESDEY